METVRQIVRQVSWAEANQICLVGEFARLRELLGGQTDAEAHAAGEAARAQMAPLPAIDRLVALFQLSAFERDILLLCAGIEMDGALAALCGGAQRQPARVHASFSLAMAALPQPHWSALSPSRPLRRFRLVDLDVSQGLTSAPLRIEERILHYLAGVNLLDSRLRPYLRECPAASDWIAAEHRDVAQRAEAIFAGKTTEPPLVLLCGDDPQGQEDVAARVAQRRGWQLYALNTQDLPAVGADLNQLSTLWERETMLLPGALVLQCVPGGFAAAARQLAERLPAPLIVASREPVRLDRAAVRFDVDKPQPVEQRRLWQQALGASAQKLNGALDNLSEQFRLSAKSIFATSALVTADDGTADSDALWNACRSLARPRLEDLAQRIVPAAGWDDLILPAQQKRMLRQLADQVRYRLKVYETWGFSGTGQRGLGVSALFAGGSGTGKTMAAEVLAGALKLDLYRIDLSAVVSKYIGETEKNLRQVFDTAEEGGVVLLFDEADALFGKRSDVKDSHDRYANIEVSYLLQRMEAYQGLAILTTNLKSTMDKAFQRRLRFIVHFPFPDATQREAIWRRAFPAKTPTAGLNPALLSQLNVTGGNIRNIALNAAFLAAAANTPVGMDHLLEAAHLEAQKIERPLAEVETRGWV
jgi:ATPase family associated with various cellular activities (AAA)